MTNPYTAPEHPPEPRSWSAAAWTWPVFVVIWLAGLWCPLFPHRDGPFFQWVPVWVAYYSLLGRLSPWILSMVTLDWPLSSAVVFLHGAISYVIARGGTRLLDTIGQWQALNTEDR